MKKTVKFITFLLIYSILFSFFNVLGNAKKSETTEISAKSACLVEADGRSILYGKSENVKMPMASTTKIMTAILALESKIPLDKVFQAPKDAAGIEGSSIYLCEGEGITLEALLYGLLLCSANDAAIAIAIICCGSVEAFVLKMNEKARALGLTNTNFVNPHGLYDGNHYTTAIDLAYLMAYCMKNEDFAKISGCYKKVFPKEDGGTRVMINHNRLLNDNCNVIAGKTGYTLKSGRCLVTCANKDNLTLICVTLNAPNDWNDHKRLYDFGFSNFQMAVFPAINYSIPLISGEKSSVSAIANEISLLLPKEYVDIDIRIYAPRFIFAGLYKGETIGKVVYVYNGKVLATAPITLSEDIPKAKYPFNLFEWLKNLFIK